MPDETEEGVEGDGRDHEEVDHVVLFPEPAAVPPVMRRREKALEVANQGMEEACEDPGSCTIEPHIIIVSMRSARKQEKKHVTMDQNPTTTLKVSHQTWQGRNPRP